jgi:C4-dicarboxylate transporter
MIVTLDLAALTGLIVAILSIAISVTTLQRFKREKDAGMKKAGQDEQKNISQQQQILDAISKLNDNVCTLYQVIVPILDSEKVNLQGLAGQKLNGNVEAAMESIDDAKKKIIKQMSGAIGGSSCG